MNKLFTSLSVLVCTIWTAVCSLASTDFAKNQVFSGNEISCSLVEKKADANSGIVVFNLKSDSFRTVNLRLWQCASQNSDKSFNVYTLIINDEQKLSVIPDKSGWGFLTLSKSVELRKGDNEIKVIADLPWIPDVEFVDIAPETSLKQPLTAYDQYVSSIKENSRLRSNVIIPSNPTDTATVSLPDISSSGVPYSYKFASIPWCGYTFYTTVYCTENQQLTCESKGADNIEHFIEVFNAEDPAANSWASLSDGNGICSFSKEITKAGTYYVRVRSFRNGERGLCTLTINGSRTYKDVPICSMGVVTNFVDSYDIYTVFTANSMGNPMITLNKGNTCDSKVFDYNDDNIMDSNYNWGNNSRISHKISKSQNVSTVIVTTASSYYPVAKCELYIGCKYTHFFDSDSENIAYNSDFPQLKPTDALNSAPATSDYNCYAWAGGICSTIFDPISPSSDHYSSFYNAETNLFATDLSIFDNYYSSERYPGCTKYVRCESVGTSADGIDLWGFKINGSYTILHASIGGRPDGNLHGYESESKAGNFERFFHPRKALTNLTAGYGRLLIHYDKIDDNDKNYLLEESVADKKCIFANTEITNSEKIYIENNLNGIEVFLIKQFDKLYDAWQKHWDMTIHSNSEIIKNCDEYRELETLCKSHNVLIYKIYDKVIHGNNSSYLLFDDLVIKNNETNFQLMMSILNSNIENVFDSTGRKIINTINSNQKKLIKQIISSDQSFRSKEAFIEQSVTVESKWDVSICAKRISINVSLYKDAYSRIDIIDLNGRVISTLCNGISQQSEEKTFTTEPQKNGTYLVRFIQDGNILIKKISI